MTAEETSKLADLQTAFDASLKAYQTEQTDNYKAHEGWNAAGGSPNGLYQGHTNEWWTIWKNSSDNSLALKKTLYDQAKASLDNFKAQLGQNAINALATTNPTLYAQTIQANAAAAEQAKADIAKADIDAKAKLAEKSFIAQNTKYFIIAGVVIVVLVIGFLVYKRSKRNKLKTA